MSATLSFIAGLLAGAAAVLSFVFFHSASRTAMRRSRKVLLAGGLGVASVAAVALAIDFRPGATLSAADPVASDSPHAVMSAATGLPPPAATSSASAMPSASMMSKVLAMPGSARGAMAEPMDEAAADLAARLERQGGTAADWNLLAQAYDFLGRREDARHARARAAEVGAIQSGR